MSGLCLVTRPCHPLVLHIYMVLMMYKAAASGHTCMPLHNPTMQRVLDVAADLHFLIDNHGLYCLRYTAA